MGSKLIGSKCYTLVEGAQRFDYSELQCEKRPGGHLASVTSWEEYRHLWQELFRSVLSSRLCDLCREGQTLPGHVPLFMSDSAMTIAG